MENITNIFGKNKSGDDKEKQGQAETSEKPCRACTDFKTWFKMGSKSNSDKKEPIRSSSEIETAQCPLDKDELGHNTWSLLHTMAAYYPERPTPTQQKEMSVFIKLFSKYYPCDHCARDFRQSISTDPPETSDRSAFSQWLCRMHNEVNRKLGKPEFDCKLVDERWKDGWEDGTCG